MKCKQYLCLLFGLAASMRISAGALEYSFPGVTDTEYYPPTSYEALYGSQYNYEGPNVIDYQIPELPYGVYTSIAMGPMEKVHIPGMNISLDSGASILGGMVSVPILSASDIDPGYQQPAYTSIADMTRKDGSIGTIEIPTLDISMKVWEGETEESMDKGLGHYSTTAAWNGNVGVCGHNRGAKYVIGKVKNLEVGDTITYTTVYGTRTYQVSFVGTISSTDWSYLQATADNRITLTTCLADKPSKRICVQAVEVV